MKQRVCKEELMMQSYFKLFRQVMSAYLSTATGKLKEYELLPSQAGLLLYVQSHEGTTQKEIADALMVKPPTVATMISRMEKRNLLERHQDSADKRKSRIYLTEHGRKMCFGVRDILIEAEERLRQVFTEEEGKQFKEYMIRIVCELGKEKDEGETKCFFSEFDEYHEPRDK